MYFKTLFIFIFVVTHLFSQENNETVYTNLKTYTAKTSDSLSINSIVKKYDAGNFTQKSNLKSYKKLENNTLWLNFLLKNEVKNNFKYLTIDNAYLTYGKVYLRRNNTIEELHQVSYENLQPFKFIFYRLPVWKISADKTLDTDVFIEIKSPGGRSRIEFFLENENTFLKRIQIECVQYGLFIAFLISMIVILLYFSILKKEYSVIYYAIYIVTVLIAFLAGTGLGIQFFWSESNFLSNNIRSLSQTLGVFFIGLFYYKFYKLQADQKLSENIFKWGIYITIPLLLLYAYKFTFGGLIPLYLYVWTILKFIGVFWFCNHIYLISKKQIPFYLVIAFALPIVTVVLHQSINPSVHTAYWQKTLIKNLYYIAIVIEILLFTRYIFGSVIKTQQKFFELKKISDELQYNFQNKTLEIQQEERNKLVSNVHDTFGGYLEALKLRLIQKNENSPEKVQEILDSFYKDYRYLLNSLYAPKINSENFIENLIDFFEKLNGLIDSKINHHLILGKTELSQDKCIHLYSIISELVTNAIKHSKSSKIQVNIKSDSLKNIILEVEDNGIGFDKNIIKNNGFGLNNIKKRVAEINGDLVIKSSNHGTKTTITIPKNE